MQNMYMFSEPERRLLLELLQQEHRQLPPEIHHTDNRDVRDELRERQQMVNQLLERLQQTGGVPYSSTSEATGLP